jgi:protein gp37
MQAYVSGALSRVSGVFADKLKVSTPVQLQWPLPNVWLGTSVEDQSAADGRIPRLLRTPAAVRFISAEPLLGPVDLAPWLAQGPVVGARAEVTTRTLRALQEVARAAHRYMGHPKLDWVIAGGESGPGARPMHPAWPRALRDACLVAGVPFFFKQWGEYAPTLGLGSRSATVLLGPSGKVFRKGVVEPGSLGMARVGKQRAGRMLDGRTWDEMPEPQPVQTEGAMP